MPKPYGVSETPSNRIFQPRSAPKTDPFTPIFDSSLKTESPQLLLYQDIHSKMIERYFVYDVYGNSWKMTVEQFNDFTGHGIALKMNKDNNEVVRNKHWIHLQNTTCPYLD